MEKRDLRSRLTEDEFEKMAKIMRENNPSLANCPESIRARMAEMDEFVDVEIRQSEEDLDTRAGAAYIALQGRNLLAMMVGEDQRDMPDWAIKKEHAEIDPLSEKSVAVWCGSTGPFENAVNKALDLASPSLRYVVFSRMSALIEELLRARLCGIVSVGHGAHSVESLIRHDLKNRTGWNYERAQACVLPPCANFGIFDIPRVFDIMFKMQEGTFGTVAEGEFSLSDALPTLVVHMIVPSRELAVLVVDDHPREVGGIVAVLTAWPNITVRTTVGSKKDITSWPYDVYLLDEDLHLGTVLTGRDIAQAVRQLAPSAVIASITGGDTPKWAKFHFADKASVGNSMEAAMEFVRLMNKLIRIHEESKRA